MDVSRPPALDQAAHTSTNASPARGAHRCGWCGLLPLPEDRASVADERLCGACLAILRHVDWRKLLNRLSSPRALRRRHEAGDDQTPDYFPRNTTGMTADPTTWADRPIGLDRAPCPGCKLAHAWSKKDCFSRRASQLVDSQLVSFSGFLNQLDGCSSWPGHIPQGFLHELEAGSMTVTCGDCSSASTW